MLKWPSKATISIRKLFEPLQEIDVYVEDANDEAFYRSMLNSATKGTVRIARVFGLGGRKAVLEAAAKHDYTKRRALFIIDGDLSWVRGENITNIKGVHQHEAYCVENLLICEQALVLVLSQESAITEQDAQDILLFNQWKKSVIQPLIELFAAFATINEIDPTVPTVSNGVGILCKNDHKNKVTELDPGKVQHARDDLISKAKAIAKPIQVDNRYSSLLHRIQSLSDPLQAISGKDFIVPLIDFRLQSLGCRIKRRALRMRLACSGDLSRFSALAESLIQAARGLPR